MPKKLKYAVVTIQRVSTLKEAKTISATRTNAEIVKISPYDERCPKGNDHAHARYDGATFCDKCGQFLSLQLEKKL